VGNGWFFVAKKLLGLGDELSGTPDVLQRFLLGT